MADDRCPCCDRAECRHFNAPDPVDDNDLFSLDRVKAQGDCDSHALTLDDWRARAKAAQAEVARLTALVDAWETEAHASAPEWEAQAQAQVEGRQSPTLAALDRALASPDAEPLCLASPEDRQRLRELVAGELGAPAPGNRQPSPRWKRDEYGGSDEYLRIGPLELIVGAIAWTVRVVATQSYANVNGGQTTTRHLEDLVAGMESTRDAAKLAAEDAARALLAAWTSAMTGGPL